MQSWPIFESAVKAVTTIGELDRATVRSLTVQRFSSDRMVDEYVAAYKHAIAASQPVRV